MFIPKDQNNLLLTPSIYYHWGAFSVIQCLKNYEVSLVKFNLSIQDHDMPGKRYNYTIFVNTGADGSGVIHQVTGDITSSNGMIYISEPTENPVRSQTFYTSLGVTQAFKYPDSW